MAELTELVTNESGQDPAYYEWLEGLPLQHPRGMLNGLRASWENKSPPESSRQCLDSWTGRLIGEEQALLGLYRIAKLPLPPILQESWRSAASSARDSARDLPERLAAIALIAEVPEANEVLLELLNEGCACMTQITLLRRSFYGGAACPQVFDRSSFNGSFDERQVVWRYSMRSKPSKSRSRN
jgi:hypothetical protein